MGVAHDAISRSHTAFPVSISEPSFSWLHTPVGYVRGVVVFLMTFEDALDATPVVTYGGVELNYLGNAQCTDRPDDGRVHAFYQGFGLPTGPQTVEVTRDNDITNYWGVCYSLTALADTGAYAYSFENTGGAWTEVNVDGLPDIDQLRYAGIFTDTNDVPPAGGGSIGNGANQSIDLGPIGVGPSIIFASAYEATPGPGMRSVGFDLAGTHARAAMYLTMSEVFTDVEIVVDRAILTITRYPLHLGPPIVVTPGFAALTITRFAPSALPGVRFVPATRALTLTPSLAMVGRVIIPGTRTLTITRRPPHIEPPVVVTVGRLALVTAHFPPDISAFTTRQLIITRYAPQIIVGRMIGRRALTLTTFAPTVLLRTIVTPGTRALILTPFPVDLGRKIFIGKRSLVLTTFAPTVSFSTNPIVQTVQHYGLGDEGPKFYLEPTFPFDQAKRPPRLRKIANYWPLYAGGSEVLYQFAVKIAAEVASRGSDLTDMVSLQSRPVNIEQWGLPLWEAAYGVNTFPDVDLVARRARILFYTLKKNRHTLADIGGLVRFFLDGDKTFTSSAIVNTTFIPVYDTSIFSVSDNIFINSKPVQVVDILPDSLMLEVDAVVTAPVGSVVTAMGVIITEHLTEYSFEIEVFDDVIGLAELGLLIEEFKPAHLGFLIKKGALINYDEVGLAYDDPSTSYDGNVIYRSFILNEFALPGEVTPPPPPVPVPVPVPLPGETLATVGRRALTITRFAPTVIVTTTPGALPLTIESFPAPLQIQFGQPETYQFVGAGGTGPYTFSWSGAIPSGMSLSTSGLLTGTMAQAPGDYTVFLMVTDSSTPHLTHSDPLVFRVIPDVPVSTGLFTVSGNRILNPVGSHFIVKGHTPIYGPFAGGDPNGVESTYSIANSAAIFTALKNTWGVNLVRIFTAGSAAQGHNPSWAIADYRNELWNVVDNALAAGLVVLLVNSYSNIADSTAWITELALRYKDEPFVWLTPSNEPIRTSPDAGEAAHADDWNYWQIVTQAQVNAIRAQGFHNPILLNGHAWSWDWIGYPGITDPDNKLIFGAHRYANGNNWTAAEIADANASWANLASSRPMVVDEVGNYNGGGQNTNWYQGIVDFINTWVTTRQGSGAIGFNHYWSDANTMTTNGSALNAWGTWYRGHYLLMPTPEPVFNNANLSGVVTMGSVADGVPVIFTPNVTSPTAITWEVHDLVNATCTINPVTGVATFTGLVNGPASVLISAQNGAGRNYALHQFTIT